jgi:hypothetical protein
MVRIFMRSARSYSARAVGIREDIPEFFGFVGLGERFQFGSLPVVQGGVELFRVLQTSRPLRVQTLLDRRYPPIPVPANFPAIYGAYLLAPRTLISDDPTMRTPRSTVVIASFIAVCCGNISSRTEAAATRPNVVLFLVDDMGWMDSGVYGSPYYETPNMDALAKRGMLFSDAYAANPLCLPTRASILTGKNPARLRFTTAAGHTQPTPQDAQPYPDRVSPSSKLIQPRDRDTLSEPVGMLGSGYWSATRGMAPEILRHLKQKEAQLPTVARLKAVLNAEIAKLPEEDRKRGETLAAMLANSQLEAIVKRLIPMTG